MIAAVEGIVEFKSERFVVLKTSSGLSYRIYASPETLRKIPEKSPNINPSTPLGVKLWTHFQQREDTAELYGFLHFTELEFFELLIQISGIGPRSALGIMGVAVLDTLKKAIAAGDTSYLTKVSGIGRKTAGKVILELREKMAGRGVSSVSAPELKEESDALSALVSLGYSMFEAREALQQLPKDISGASARVRAALKHLGQSLS